MTKYASTTHLLLLKQTSKMVEDLIDALHNYKAVCEYQGLDFTFDKVKKFEEMHKALTKNYKEEYVLGSESLSEKPIQGFSGEEGKIELCKIL